ncbi:glycosyltransferase family 2 protein [Mongoliitalea lutea]|uniref:Glycosyl transferase n=1 Tax=Mongoliitalea lutea TaxID=849756 RepID=A0A8J3CV42_9BACT|nr:glycosyltransferase family A protein [Mongoliitalea lutea]GHB23833.1 glycosyl transferase [Mongoliitalea lutea]
MISVIIPSYNSRKYLLEAIDSVLKINDFELEVIVVNDGSIFELTLDLYKKISDPRVTIIHQSNMGLASARNNGVSLSKGEYILFLDDDNLIRRNYFEYSINAFEMDQKIGIVYGLPHFFGATSDTPRFKTIPYSFDALLAGNYIDACVFIRRSAFEEVGGFHVHPDLAGWEDADLWLRLSQTQWKFHFLNQVVFDYRVREDSMMGVVDQERRERMLQYFGAKYGYLYHKKYRQYFRVLDNIQKNPFSYFLRILYYKYILRKPFIK